MKCEPTDMFDLYTSDRKSMLANILMRYDNIYRGRTIEA